MEFDLPKLNDSYLKTDNAINFISSYKLGLYKPTDKLHINFIICHFNNDPEMNTVTHYSLLNCPIILQQVLHTYVNISFHVCGTYIMPFGCVELLCFVLSPTVAVAEAITLDFPREHHHIVIYISSVQYLTVYYSQRTYNYITLLSFLSALV